MIDIAQMLRTLRLYDKFSWITYSMPIKYGLRADKVFAWTRFRPILVLELILAILCEFIYNYTKRWDRWSVNYKIMYVKCISKTSCICFKEPCKAYTVSVNFTCTT